MKIFRLVGLSLVSLMGLGVLAAQEARQNAIIVVRHAEDAAGGVGHTENGKKTTGNPWPSAEWSAVAPDWPQHFYSSIFINKHGNMAAVNQDAVVPKAHALSGNWLTSGGVDGTKMKKDPDGQKPLGELQAIALRDNLGSLLEQANLADVTRAITMDPQVQDATPNPFDTIWPFLAKNSTIELYLVERDPKSDKYAGMMALIEENEVLPSNGSALICWTGEGLEGDDGILAKLTEKYRPGKNYWGDTFIERCSDIFVFYRDAAGNGVAEKWKMDKEGKITLIEKHGEK